MSSVETDAFITRLRAEGLDIRVRVYLCRDERRRPSRNGGIGRSKRPGISCCSSTHPSARRDPMLDLFYLVIGVVGFLALWGIAKACDRV
jgi:hypothetical protein